MIYYVQEENPMSILSHEFEDKFREIVGSEGKLKLPNCVLVEDAQEGLNFISRSHAKVEFKPPFQLLLREFDLPINHHQTKEVCLYPKFFFNSRGMSGRFDGSGYVLASPGHVDKAQVYSFFFCDHDWDETGANHSRGWHPARCKKCGFNASIDSGD